MPNNSIVTAIVNCSVQVDINTLESLLCEGVKYVVGRTQKSLIITTNDSFVEIPLAADSHKNELLRKIAEETEYYLICPNRSRLYENSLSILIDTFSSLKPLEIGVVYSDVDVESRDFRYYKPLLSFDIATFESRPIPQLLLINKKVMNNVFPLDADKKLIIQIAQAAPVVHIPEPLIKVEN